jgi:hypothetical protein
MQKNIDKKQKVVNSVTRKFQIFTYLLQFFKIKYQFICQPASRPGAKAKSSCSPSLCSSLWLHE